MKVKKILNNNAIITEDNNEELILTGRGIGYDVAVGDEVDKKLIEKKFVFSEGEKALSLRILKFYKNINKLDEYLSQTEEGRVSNFEVLPSSALAIKESVGTSFSGKKLGTNNEKSSEKLTKAISDRNSLEAELEALLVNYAEGSLEYKTITQELKRLQNKK